MTIWQKLSARFGGKKAAILSVLYGLRSGSSSGFMGSSDDMPYGKAVNEGYKGQVWTYRCIKAIGEAVGSVEWKAYKAGSSGAAGMPIEGHPFAALMNRPNPYLTRMEYFDAWAAHLNLSGCSYSEIVYAKGTREKPVPKFLFPLRPDWVKPIPDPNTFIRGYELDAKGSNGKPIPYKPEEILWMKFFHPLDDYKGLAPITAAQKTIAVENSAISWNKNIFDNSAMTSGILNVPEKNLLPEDRKQIRDEMEEEFTRENTFRPMVTWGGMTWTQIGLSQNDMQFLNQRKVNKYEICAIFGVPPQIIGANEDPTYSNYSVALLAFWESKIIPLLTWIETTFNTRFSAQYFDGVVVKPDIASVPALRESFGQKVKQAQILSQMGWPINAVNERLGLGFEPVPWGDMAYMSGTMVPADMVGETPAELGTEPNPIQDGSEEGDDEEETVAPETEPSLDIEEGGEEENSIWSRKTR